MMPPKKLVSKRYSIVLIFPNVLNILGSISATGIFLERTDLAIPLKYPESSRLNTE